MNNEQIAEAIGNLTAPQLVALTKQLEQQWGLGPAPVPTFSVVPTTTLELLSHSQTEFTVVLTNTGPNRIGVIKALREILGLGLKEAKDFSESVPQILKEGIEKSEADSIKEKLETVGASIEIK